LPFPVPETDAQIFAESAFARRCRKRVHGADEIRAGLSPSGLWSILSGRDSSK